MPKHMSDTKPKIVVIAGPTASGKTSLAIEIAKEFNGEVISADSRQIYRKLDIGTAKVTPEETQGIPHHLINIKDVNEVYSASDFSDDAKSITTTLLEKNKLPIVAGGTFFYVDAFLNKTSLPAVEPKPELRTYLEDLSTEMLFDELSRLDPARAKAIDPNNKRRLIRALEIVHELGTVPSPQPTVSPYNVLTIGLRVEKEVLREKFLARAEDWLKNGFKDEVTNLLTEGVSRDRLREIGFEYSLGLDLTDEVITDEEFKQRFIEKNWQYAKRQITWLKRDDKVEWYEPQNREAILRRVREFLG